MLEISLGTARQYLRDSVLVRSFSFSGGRGLRSTLHTRITDVLETTEVFESCHVGKPHSKDSMINCPVKCIWTKACSIGHKQEELETIAQLENYDIAITMEAEWDDWHNPSATMDGYKPFLQGISREGDGGVATMFETDLVSRV